MKKFLLSFIRRTVILEAVPACDLQAKNAETFEWQSTGETPTFDLKTVGEKQSIPSGWVYVQSKLVRRGANLVAQLYADGDDRGSVVDEVFTLPTTRPGNIKHIIKLPRGTRRLRLVPMRGKGTIFLHPIAITKIGFLERVVRMLEWVASDLRKFKNTNQLTQYNLTWHRWFFDLESAYADCAKLRIHSAPPEYDSYVEAFDTLNADDIDAIERHIKSLPRLPLISVLMPVYNAPLDYLKSAIESVRSQIYRNWELCIADDQSNDPDVIQYLKTLPREDERIKVVFRGKNGHISAASNSALELASGEFSALLDQDDLLPKHALYFVALKILEQGNVNVIYSDEDKIDDNGFRSDPYFKSDWNPDLFLSHNMISHLGVYRTSLLREIGGFREGFEGSQDYDLALRCVKQSTAEQIAHIPRVLYHWRQHSESTAANPNAKRYAYVAAERGLADFLKDDPNASVQQGKFIGTYRVKYTIPGPLPKTSIIIPTRDGYPILKKCIDSLRNRTNYSNLEILVVDNQSSDKKTLEYLESLKSLKNFKILKYDRPFNYSAINNFAVEHATGEILCFLNDDVEATDEGWLYEMVSHAIRPDIGVVGAKLLYADGFVQHAGVILGIGGFAGHAHKLYPEAHPGYAGRAVLIQNFSAVTGACMVVRKKIFEAVGGFNAQHLPVAFNDIDLCLRIREAGYRVLWTPYAVLYHYESYSRGDDQMSPEKRARFNGEKEFMNSRWQTGHSNDPYYNPNLTLDRENFTLANLPRLSNPWKDYMESR